LFENELEVGRWYKSENELGCTLGFFQGFDVETYGIAHFGDWVQNAVWFSKKGSIVFDNFGNDLQHLTPATEQEVFVALKNEAIKRGYKEGVTCLFGSIKDKRTIKNNIFDFEFDLNRLSIGGNIIFFNGTWVEIVKQPKQLTISEIEKILGYKILIKE
jgi:hypothetical protein